MHSNFNSCSNVCLHLLHCCNLLYLLQSTRASFPHVLFKVPAHDHTACKDGHRWELAQCAPAGQGKPQALQISTLVSI
jgi:hypothetical protein